MSEDSFRQSCEHGKFRSVGLRFEKWACNASVEIVHEGTERGWSGVAWLAWQAALADSGVRELRAELQNIANAVPSEWEEDMRDQFQQWAQNRARAALAKSEGK